MWLRADRHFAERANNWSVALGGSQPPNAVTKTRIKRDSERLFCDSQHPGEDWFHLLLNGEIFASRQH